MALLACEADPAQPHRVIERAPTTPAIVVSEAAPARGRPGVVLSELELEVRVPTDARIVELLVDAGAEVSAGELLARLDTAEVQAELRVTEADLRALRRERAALVLATKAGARERDTVRALQQRGWAAQAELDAAELETDRATLAVSELDARIEGLVARTDRLRTLAREREVRSPIDGIVATRSVTVGTWVPATTTLMRLLAREAPRVRFAIEPSDRGAWALGRALEVREDGVARTWPAHVIAIAPELDPISQQIFVDARLDDAPTTWPAGAPVWVSAASP